MEIPREMRDFVRIVRDMRALQRKYFKTNDPGILQAAKRAEKIVDALLESFEKTTEPNLFPVR